MRDLILILTAAAAPLCTPAQAGESAHATPAEVIDKVRAAAALLEAEGAAALAVIGGPDSRFMWKDSYVFVVNCEADRVMANPAFPARVGGDIKQHSDYAGKRYGRELCALTAGSGGGWLEYRWPRSGSETPVRKVSYVVSVPGRPYQVGAGIYDAHMSIEELTALSDSGD